MERRAKGAAGARRTAALGGLALVAWAGCNAIIGLDQPVRETSSTSTAGLCADVVCNGDYPCHEPGYCDPALGQCVYPVLPDNTPCDDGSLCTTDDTCHGGHCSGVDAVVCAYVPNSCHETAGCDPRTGQCVYYPAPDGQYYCDDGSVCTEVDSCQGGICNPGADHTWASWSPDAGNQYIILPYAVADQSTGRVWQRISSNFLTRGEAQQFCAGLSLPEFASGWRLPTRIELLSIVDYTRVGPAIDEAFLVAASRCWTSSSVADGSGYWAVDLYNGELYISGSDELNGVLCVR